jgi:predicted aspartyl protease
MAIVYFIRIVCLVCICHTYSLAAMADPLKDTTAAKPIEKDPVIKTDSAHCTIPFSRAGNLIIIRAKVDTTEGNFILDTGAPGLVLNIPYFRNYTALEGTDDIQGGVTGRVEDAGRVNIDSLSFGPIHYYKAEADRINLGHIENRKGIKIHGLLGMQLFKKFEMIIDYENNLIHLHHLTKKDDKNYRHPLLQDTATYIEASIDFIENKLITYVYSAGKKLSFVVDSGAETNLIDSRLPDKIIDNVIVNKRIFLSGTGSKRVEALSGSINELTIGNYNVANLPIVVTNLEKLCFAYNRCLDGMLGFDFLSRQKIGFNFVKRKMYIWK